MIENIEKEIIKFVQEKSKNDVITTKMIFEKFYFDRTDFTVGLPGYFKGWQKPVARIMEKCSVIKIKNGWKRI